MSLSSPFIRRPVGTTLLTIAIALAGAIAYTLLPVSPLPQVEFPTIQVNAGLPGASPETMASAVVTPLERQFGRIAGVTEMTSTSNQNSCNITLQFDLSRNIDSAARDVQAAINAARGQLPANLPNNPNYKKVNPGDAPIVIFAMTSDVYDKAHMYDAASSILAQKIAQVPGVGQVSVGGSSLPAVRVDVNPTVVNSLGLSLEDVRTSLGNANANRPKGTLNDDQRNVSLTSTDQLRHADEYKPLIIAYRNGAPVRLDQVANVTDGIEDIRTAGLANGRPSVLLVISRQPGANIISTVDKLLAMLPQLRAQIPAGMNLDVVLDRTTTIRASVHDVQITLLISIGLVVLVVFVFLRSPRATFIPSVAVPVSLIGTFGVMYLCNYSLDNLSLMAMAIATGFVVDDAIVVIENISRHIEAGMSPRQAAFQGAREIGFTVMSISLSLVAVFIPLLLMQGIVGRLFREFAVTLSVAVGISMVVSLTTTPMLCALLLHPAAEEKRGRLFQWTERGFDWILNLYAASLTRVLRHPLVTLMVMLATIATTVYLYQTAPKNLFPSQDTGRMSGGITADQDTSFQQMSRLLTRFATIVSQDKAVDSVIAFCGGGGPPNTGRMFVALKPLAERQISVDNLIIRLRKPLSQVPGASLNLSSVQDLRFTGRQGNGNYQLTLQGDNLEDLISWAPRVMAGMQKIPGVQDVNSDQQNRGMQAFLEIDRATAAKLHLTPQMVDDTLYDAFGQRPVSTMYTPLNQYHVVMEAPSDFWQNPDGLHYIYVRSTTGKLIPLDGFTHYVANTTSLTVNHSSQFPSVTISFNLDPGYALNTTMDSIDAMERNLRLPPTIQVHPSGTAQVFQDSTSGQKWLILATIFTVYIVLGVLYESLIHPITILSTLPSAGVGALLALRLFNTDLTVIASIGIILLIGIVKKNAIMMIDFALEAERKQGLGPRDAIYQACLLRFRPIIMTTMAALLGGLPLALGTGTGSELRRPLGIAIVGGLIFSQLLTLYTTPVVYLYLDRLRLWLAGSPSQLKQLTPPPLVGNS